MIAYTLATKENWKKSIMFGLIVVAVQILITSLLRTTFNLELSSFICAVLLGIVAYIIASNYKPYKSKQAVNIGIYTALISIATSYTIIVLRVADYCVTCVTLAQLTQSISAL